MSSTASANENINTVIADPLSVPRPPNCPMFVESTHFYSKCSPALIRQHLDEICRSMSIDVMPGSDLFSMSCSAYIKNYSVEFLLSIFTDDKSGTKDRYLIEIQRRRGDSYPFQEAVFGLRTSLGERKVIEKVAPVKRGWGDKAKAAIAARNKSCGPDALARLQAKQSPDGCVFRSVHKSLDTIPIPASAYSAFPIVEKDVVVASVNHAVALSASPYEDVKSEAIRSLADMASQEQSQRALLASKGSDGCDGEGIKVAVACLRSFTPDVHRCAASTLANMMSASSGDIAAHSRKLVELHNGADELFHLILREKSENYPESAPVSPQVLRECVRALVALYGDSAAGKVERSKNTNADMVIQKLRSHYCPVLREYAERLDATLIF